MYNEISVNLALLAKDKGFDGYCNNHINNPNTKIFYSDPINEDDCAQCGRPSHLHYQDGKTPFFCDPIRKIKCPSLQVLVQWLIDKHDMLVIVYPDEYQPVKNEWRWVIIPLSNEKSNTLEDTTELIIYPTYKDALVKGVERALNYIE